MFLRHRQWYGLCATALLGMAAPAAGGGFAGGPTIGSLGVGAEASWFLGDRLSLRASAHGINWGIDGSQGGVDYDADLRLRSAGGWVDWAPFGGRFQLTGGLLLNGNEVKGRGIARDGEYEIGGQVFSAEDVGQLDASVDFNSVAPYLGLRWRFGPGRLGPGIGMGLDLGILFQGSPKVSLTSSGGSLSNEPALLEALRAEEAEFEDDIDKYDLFPVAMLSLFYRF